MKKNNEVLLMNPRRRQQVSLRIASNISSLQAQRNVSNTFADKNANIRKMAAGSRIVDAKDDAAGLAISAKLNSQIRSKRMADRNTSEGISFMQMAEGGLNEISSSLTRLRELAIQAATDTYSNLERELINTEYLEMRKEVQRIAESTAYGGTFLLNGDGKLFDFQVDINNNKLKDRITFDSSETDTTIQALNIHNLDVATAHGARQSLENIDKAINKVSKQRASLGGYQNRLTSTTNNLKVSDEHQSSAHSRIKDLDFAIETADLAKNNIKEEAGMSLLAQANIQGQTALKLL